VSIEGGTEEISPVKGRRKRNRTNRRGQRETMINSSDFEYQTPNGQRSTQQAEEYESDPATTKSMRSRHQRPWEKQRGKKWDITSRPRKEKYRRRDVTGDNEAGSNPLVGKQPTLNGLKEIHVNNVSVITECDGDERWRDEGRNGEDCGTEVPLATPTPSGTQSSKSARAKRKGSKGRASISSDKRFTTPGQQHLVSNLGEGENINDNRVKGGVMPSQTKRPSHLEARYNRPKDDRRKDYSSKGKGPSTLDYFKGLNTWVKLVSQNGGDGKQPVTGAQGHLWEEQRMVELWKEAVSQPDSGETIACDDEGARSGSPCINGQQYVEAPTRTLVVDVMTASAENVQGGKEAKGKKTGAMWNLKGRSIDDILKDLEALKNDPDIPMPVIEADPATIEDFTRYITGLPIVENGETEAVGDEEEEKIKDKESLISLKGRSGHSFLDLRPQGFPEELWPYVMNDQKALVQERWEGYDPDTIAEEVAFLLTELKVSPERKYAQPYFQAQALANLDRLVVKGREKITPMIHSKYTHRMELIPGTRPRKELPQRFSETQNAFLKAKLAILEREGRIIQKEGLEKSDWLHRLVIVENAPKMAAFRLKYGNDVQQALNDPDNSYEISQLCRLTIDCREINKCLVVEPYPMPDLNIGKENIIGSRYLSTSDAADAFYTVPIREEDFGKTTVAALGKQWAFKVMLQGGINSARHYARVIAETFDGIPKSKILPYQDDALVHAKNLSDAIDNQQLLYDCIRPNSIMLKPSKTRIGYSSTKFLGDIYTAVGRLPDPARVEGILRMEGRPKTLKQVRHIVGLLVWNIEFIPNGMGILSYLTDLMRKDADIIADWKEEVHGKAILQLKAALTSPPCLKPIDVARPFRVHVDACKNGRGMGAVLLQEHYGQWRPCSYFSRALTPAQRQWSATELEAHALVSAARHWERYLQNGHKWTAVVDHKALIFLVVKRTKTNNTRLLNSVMYLQGHYFDIIHRNGDEHFDADAVSRILQSGDIDEALGAVDLAEPDDKEVTMRDMKNLSTLLQLQLTQYGYLKQAGGDKQENRTVIGKEANSMATEERKDTLEGIVNSGELRVEDQGDNYPIEALLPDEITEFEAQVNTLVNTSSQGDRMARREAYTMARDKGLQEAQEKARVAQRQIQERKQLSSKIEEGIDSQDGSSSSSGPAVEETGEDPNEDDYEEEGFGLEQNIDDRYKGVQEDPQRMLLQSGPHRWTPATMNEYVERYVPLEGRLWVHPRTRRLYQISNVFFYEKYQLAAAYSRVCDGGQPDPTDRYPHRIAGQMGLEELVEAFEKSGGSLGKSKTAWPKSELEWATIQEQDKVLGPIILKLKKERDELLARLPTTPRTMSKEERLHHDEERSKVTTQTKERGRVLVYDGTLRAEQLDSRHPNLQYVVPAALQLNIIELYHDSMGHPGAERTTDTARLSYWWHGMVSDIDNYVKGCKACARRKAYNCSAAVPIQEYDSPTMPWQRAHIDIAGKLTTSHQGNEYVLVVKDALTRFVETAALKSKTAEEVAKAFINMIVYRHGGVKHLISDNGGEFDNTLWAQTTQLLQIEHSTTSPYNPRANGLAENHMRTLKDAIGIYCDESQMDWDEHLAGTTMSYNTTVNSQTGYTPYYMMYGREARLPSESWLRHFSHVRGIRPYVQELVRGLVRVWDEVSAKKHDQVVAMQKGQRPIHHLKYYDFNKGDYAMVCVVPKAKTLGWIDTQYRQINLKLQPRYAGPYLILRKVSPVVYVLEVDGTEKTFHAINMKPYQGKKDALTPFVEPGYERMEAGEMRQPETPLLLSPDENLNEKATSKYKKRKLSAKQQTTKAVNAARSRHERYEQTKHRLSNSQSEGVWRLVDAEDHEGSEEEFDDEEEDTQGYVDTEETGGLDEGRFTEQTYMVEERKLRSGHKSTTTKEPVELNEELNSVSFTIREREMILGAAQINFTALQDEERARIDDWIEAIGRSEKMRKNGLSDQDKLLEEEIATDYEYIGWILRQTNSKWINSTGVSLAAARNSHEGDRC